MCTWQRAGLEHLPTLNTLVAKQNAISELGDCLSTCSGLQKLSMAHNDLSSLGGCLRGCTQLKELRLNHNSISGLPPDLAANAQLRILDLGDNPIASVAVLKVLNSLPLHCSSYSSAVHAHDWRRMAFHSVCADMSVS